MDVLTYCPSYTSSGALVPRTLRSQFGDGYVQEAADGINAMLRKYALVWDNVSLTGAGITFQTLDAFFTAQQGYLRFLWTPPPPLDIQGIYVCTDWNYSWDAGQISSFRANLEQRA